MNDFDNSKPSHQELKGFASAKAPSTETKRAKSVNLKYQNQKKLRQNLTQKAPDITVTRRDSSNLVVEEHIKKHRKSK